MNRANLSDLRAVALLWCLLLAGCSAPTDSGIVSEIVTLDGQPLSDGVVRYVPKDGRSTTTSTRVLDGQFRTEVPVGLMRVEFSAPKVVGTRKMYDTPDSPTVDDVEELIPDRYNVRTELSLEVHAGSQEKKFQLQSGR